MGHKNEFNYCDFTLTSSTTSSQKLQACMGAAPAATAVAELPDVALSSNASSSAMQSEQRACTSRAFSSSGLMFSGAIASLTSGSGPDARCGLGVPVPVPVPNPIA